MRDATHYARRLGPGRVPDDQLATVVPRLYAGDDVALNVFADTAGEPLEVAANHGRWVVQCPCGGAQLAHPDDRRFLCCDCGNVDNAGRYRPVVWPKAWQQIGQLLDARADRTLRNWRPGETVAELRRENKLLETAVVL